MKKHTNKIKEFIKGHKIISLLIAVVLLFVLYKVFVNKSEKIETVVVKRGDIIQKVIVNGKTKPVDSVSLAFEVSGTVRNSYVKVGSRVSTGQILASLDQGSIYADLLKAQASVKTEEATLEGLKIGAKPEDIAVSQTEVTNAKVAFEDSKKNLSDKISDIISTKVDQFFSNPHSNSPYFNLQLSDVQLRNDIESGRLEAEKIVVDLKNNINNDGVTKISKLIENIAKAIGNQSVNSSLSSTVLDGYKTDISSARSTFITAKETYNSALSSLNLAENNLTLKKSGSTKESINAQEAKVLQAKAQVQSVEAQLNKMNLRSPQNGIVTLQEAKVGEAVSSGKVVISVISDNNLEIESNVSEVSIGKVSIGNEVNMTFDAFPGETFKGTVTYIEPAETIVDGVVNYKVTVAFKEKYEQIKSGLTSKLEIITGQKSGVLVIPQYAINTKDGKTFVSKKIGDSFVETEVTVGLRGQDGSVEVLSGLNVEDVVNMVVPAK